jgi:hypothetical protein
MKIKGKLFNIGVYTLLGYSILSFVYLSLPVEYQDILDLDWLTALVSGSSTFLLGSGAVAVRAFLTKAKNEQLDMNKTAMDKWLAMVGHYQALQEELAKVKTQNDELIKLLKIDLGSKLSNPLIEQTIKEQIEGALYGSQEE